MLHSVINSIALSTRTGHTQRMLTLTEETPEAAQWVAHGANAVARKQVIGDSSGRTQDRRRCGTKRDGSKNM